MTIKTKDYLILIALFLISFISVYFLPMMITRVIFLIILFAAYRTKLDYVYLVWFFIINDAPGRLFVAGTFDSARIPLYPIMAGVSVGFQELFIMLYLLKYLKYKRASKFIFKKEFTWFVAFAIMVAVFSLPFGMSFDNLIRTYRYLLPWALVFVVPAFIYDKKTLIRTSLLLFPIVFLALISQFYSYISGEYLDEILRGVSTVNLKVDEEIVSRSYSAVFIILFSIVQALYFLFNRKTEINRNYLGAVIFLGYLSIIMTATRGWIIALFAILLGVLVFFGFMKGNANVIRLAIVSSIVFIIAQYQFPVINLQLNASYNRFNTIEALMRGDMTAGGTLERLNVRGPKVMERYWESPIVGLGFSDEFYKHQDGHVGNQNILLNVGILGYILLIGLFIRISRKIWKMSRRMEFRIYENRAPLVFLFGLIAVFIIHSSSAQFWGYTLLKYQVIFIAFFMAAVNAVYLSRQNSTQSPVR